MKQGKAFWSLVGLDYFPAYQNLSDIFLYVCTVSHYMILSINFIKSHPNNGFL